MTAQLDLFNQPKTRRNDHDTSRVAAAASAKGSAELEATILALFTTDATFTDDELADAMAEHRHRWGIGSVKTARSRLSKRGLLVDTIERRPSMRSKPQIVWGLAP